MKDGEIKILRSKVLLSSNNYSASRTSQLIDALGKCTLVLAVYLEGEDFNDKLMRKLMVVLQNQKDCPIGQGLNPSHTLSPNHDPGPDPT